MESGCGEKEIRDFQQKVHGAWMDVYNQPKGELDDMQFLSLKQKSFDDMCSISGPSREAFYPLIVERLRNLPHLGIFDENDVEKIMQRVLSFEPKGKILMTPDVTEMLVIGNVIEKMLKNKGKPELLNREYLPDDFDNVPKQYRRFVKGDTKKIVATMFTDFTTLWTFEDADGRNVVRERKMDVDPEVIEKRLAELPDCVPKIKANFDNGIATFYIRYINGRLSK